jgi:hypothetical protein
MAFSTLTSCPFTLLVPKRSGNFWRMSSRIVVSGILDSLAQARQRRAPAKPSIIAEREPTLQAGISHADMGRTGASPAGSAVREAQFGLTDSPSRAWAYPGGARPLREQRSPSLLAAAESRSGLAAYGRGAAGLWSPRSSPGFRPGTDCFIRSIISVLSTWPICS